MLRNSQGYSAGSEAAVHIHCWVEGKQRSVSSVLKRKDSKTTVKKPLVAQKLKERALSFVL